MCCFNKVNLSAILLVYKRIILQETQTTNLWGEYLANISENNDRIEKIFTLVNSMICTLIKVCLFVSGETAPQWARASSFTRFLDHTQRRTTVGRTPLDEWSARRRDFYLTTNNTHNRQTSMPSVGFEPTVWAGERPQTYALDRAATGTGSLVRLLY